MVKITNLKFKTTKSVKEVYNVPKSLSGEKEGYTD